MSRLKILFTHILSKNKIRKQTTCLLLFPPSRDNWGEKDYKLNMTENCEVYFSFIRQQITAFKTDYVVQKKSKIKLNYVDIFWSW